MGYKNRRINKKIQDFIRVTFDENLRKKIFPDRVIFIQIFFEFSGIIEKIKDNLIEVKSREIELCLNEK